MTEKGYQTKRALSVETFAKLKDLVRDLEEAERRLGQDFVGAEMEFRLDPGMVAWYVAYSTAAATIPISSLRGPATSVGESE